MTSVQLERYLAERAAGVDVLAAADRAGLGETEALLTEKAIEKGDLELPRACVPARAREDGPTTEESSMARDNETTISVNGGPDVPASVVKEALDVIQGRKPINGDAETASAKMLKLFIERVERLDSEIKGLNEDKSDVFQEIKSNGYDTKTVKTIIRLRKMTESDRQEAASLLETYARAVDLQHALPL